MYIYSLILYCLSVMSFSSSSIVYLVRVCFVMQMVVWMMRMNEVHRRIAYLFPSPDCVLSALTEGQDQGGKAETFFQRFYLKVDDSLYNNHPLFNKGE